MRSLNLNALGVDELNEMEMTDANGGFGWIDVVDCLLWYVDFAESYREFGRNHPDIVTVGANCM